MANHLKKPTSSSVSNSSAQNGVPRVSIITAVYNARHYLNDCIVSILSQTYPDFEYIIIDGGSSDGTVDIIKQYQDQLAYWVSEPDNGIYDAWNKGLAVSKGEWVAFVGADDILYPEMIEMYMNHIDRQPNSRKLEFVSSRIELVRDDLSCIRTVGALWRWDLFKKNMITWHVGCFHAKAFFDRYGTFDPHYKICGDYELLMRPKDQLVASFIDQPTVRMRAGGVSSTRLYQSIDETYQAKIKNGLMTAAKGTLLKNIDKVRVFLTQFSRAFEN